MRKLLLASTGTVHGTGYLDHLESAVKDLFEGCRRVLFVPYALHDRDAYGEVVRRRFERLDLDLDSVHRAADPARAVDEAEGIYVGGGNTFRLLRALHDEGLGERIRERALGGLPYMGTSAGSNVACATIKTTNDMPIVEPPGLAALRLVPFQINPHYVDADPRSTHMGETRETRIREYLEENDAPVVGLREGAWLRVVGDDVRLGGDTGARLFLRGADPRELGPGADLGFLLASP